MIKTISLEHFKCFNSRQTFRLAPINILYGKNGRGKSSLIQSLLLLAQTMQKCDEIRELHLVGRLVGLGTFKDVANVYAHSDTFGMEIETDAETLKLEFEQDPDKIQMARLNKLFVNDNDRFDIMTDDVSQNLLQAQQQVRRVVGATSDIITLQRLKQIQYVSANRRGPQNYSQRNDSLPPDWAGVEGEYVINVLSNKGKDFRDGVCNDLSQILSGATLDVKEESSDRIGLYIDSKNDNEQPFRPANVGFGYSYVLPVIVAAHLAANNSMLIIENPEAHLHPAAQSRLMKFLIRQTKEKKLQLLVESHSDHVVNGLRVAMKQNYESIAPDDAQILFFSQENECDTQVVNISCDSKGELSEYPDDFLDEWTRQLLQLV